MTEVLRQTKSTFMCLNLHHSVIKAVSNEITSVWFNAKGTDGNSSKTYSTHVIGKFKCSNQGCSKDGWGSKKVAILIRGYPKNGYNDIVFNQRYESCRRLGIFTLDEDSYIERFAYRLRK